MKTRRVRIGCAGWYYGHWKGEVYPANLPTSRWFDYYQRTHDTVELNAPFYHWPRLATVRNWARQAAPGFQYSVKVNRLITHLKRFNGTKRLVGNFCRFAEVLGAHMGCFLFQLPPSFHYTEARLRSIVGQIDRRRRNVVEFRHPGWWNEDVFAAFRDAGLIFCSVSAPRLPDDVIRTGNVLYVRFHGAAQWYRHDYSDAELKAWAKKIRAAGAREVWAYFNNDFQGCAFRNAQTFKRLLR
ncbi:MAG: DUF72 domain-containing protein [Verrucomicrobiota bacterium]|nr:DUF72 domain-containing protein [Verrucomicrobiota bacterium]